MELMYLSRNRIELDSSVVEMGSYLSLPFSSRKVMHIEPSSRVMQETMTEVNAVQEPKEEPKEAKEEPKEANEEPKEAKEEPKEEAKEEPKEEAKEEPAESAHAMIARVSSLTLSIPSDTEQTVRPTEEENSVRIPEFRSSGQAESAAVKKFNRKHRKNHP
jgi:hypothetical protein